MVPTPTDRRTVLRTVATLAGVSLAGCVGDDDSSTETAPGSSLGLDPRTTALYDPDALFEATHDGFLTLDVSAYRDATSALPEPLVRSTSSVAESFAVDPASLDRVTVVGAFDRADPDAYHDDRVLFSAAGTGEVDADATGTALDERHVDAVGSHRDRTVYARTSRYDDSRTTAYAVGPGVLVGAVVDAGPDGDEGPLVRTVTHVAESAGGDPDEERSGSGETTPGGERTRTSSSSDTSTPSDVPSTPTIDGSRGGTPPADATARDAVRLQLDALAGAADGYAPTALHGLIADPDAPLVGGAAVDGDDLRDLFFSGDPGSGVATAMDDLLAGLRAASVAGSVEPGAERPASLAVRLSYADESSADAAPVRALLEALRETESVAAALDRIDVSASADGRVVRIDAEGDARSAFEAFRDAVEADRHQRAPQVAFAFEADGGGPVRIVHEEGDAVERLRVRYVVDERTRTETWTESDGVSAGDAFTTAAAPDAGTRLRVIWVSPSGDATATVGAFSVLE